MARHLISRRTASQRHASRRLASPGIASLHPASQRNVTHPQTATAIGSGKMMFVSDAELAAKIEAIAGALMDLAPGKTITYATLSVAAGETVTASSYLLRQALKLAEKQSGTLYANVRKTGFKRLTTAAAPSVGKHANSRIRGVARRTRNRLETVRANDMTAAGMVELDAYRVHFGMIEGMAREQSVKAIAKQVEQAAPVTARSLAEGMALAMRATATAKKTP